MSSSKRLIVNPIQSYCDIRRHAYFDAWAPVSWYSSVCTCAYGRSQRHDSHWNRDASIRARRPIRSRANWQKDRGPTIQVRRSSKEKLIRPVGRVSLREVELQDNVSNADEFGQLRHDLNEARTSNEFHLAWWGHCRFRFWRYCRDLLQSRKPFGYRELKTT